MQSQVNRGFARKLLKDRDIERNVLMPEARRAAAKLQQRTHRRSGRTAGSTRVEGGHMNVKRDRRAVWVMQDFGAVPMNWRTQQHYMLEAVR